MCEKLPVADSDNRVKVARYDFVLRRVAVEAAEAVGDPVARERLNDGVGELLNDALRCLECVLDAREGETVVEGRVSDNSGDGEELGDARVSDLDGSALGEVLSESEGPLEELLRCLEVVADIRSSDDDRVRVPKELDSVTVNDLEFECPDDAVRVRFCDHDVVRDCP